MVTNRDAKANTHPYPIMLYTNSKAYISISIKELGNKFFKIRDHRERWTSLQVLMNMHCVAKYVEYHFTANILLQSKEEQKVTFTIKYSKPDGSPGFKVHPFGKCKPSSKYIGWTTY